MLNRAVQMLIATPDPTHGGRRGRDCERAFEIGSYGTTDLPPRPGQITLGEKWAASGQAPLGPGNGQSAGGRPAQPTRVGAKVHLGYRFAWATAIGLGHLNRDLPSAGGEGSGGAGCSAAWTRA